jgi:hypothetical protein
LTGIFPDSLWAKVYIDIRSPSFRKFPIAISSFKAPALPGENTNFGERAREILHDDLSLSGFFALRRGVIEGVAAPESANNASAQSCLIPLLSLGIPPNVVIVDFDKGDKEKPSKEDIKEKIHLLQYPLLLPLKSK